MLAMNFGILLLFACLMCSANYYYTTNERKHWYIYEKESFSPAFVTFMSFFSFYLILNSLIPLDLLCSTEVQRLYFTAATANDAWMISPETG